VCLLAPGHLLERISDKDLILLSASPNAGVYTVEGSGIQGEEDESDMGETPEKKVERLTSAGDMRCNVFIGNN
jgi:hypothetical protein